MINIDNILNTPVQTDPWEYKLIDQILDEELLEKITKEVVKISKFLDGRETDQNGVWLHKAIEYGFDPDVAEMILEVNKKLLHIAPKLMEKFSSTNTSKIGYFSIPRFGYCVAGQSGGIHDDGEFNDKAMIMVIYLYPEESVGTKIYTDDDENTFVKELEWKTNRAFLFAPVKDVTWHNFHANENSRVVLNFYYERMEDLSYLNNLSEDKIEWFYNQFASDNVSVELKDL
jgi:hypothetical protein